MKHLIFSILIILASVIGSAQIHQAATSKSYQAANWKTSMLENTALIKIPEPPSPSKTQEEVKAVKEAMRRVDEKKQDAIKYWDAGAPAYRWNQIAPKLISWNKPDVVLRTPSAWMNLAIYNATILAWKEKVKFKRMRPHLVDPSLKPAIKAPSTYAFPCEHSVTAAAAATILAYFYPEKGDSIVQLARTAAQSRVDAGMQFPTDVEAGWSLGEQVAMQIIEKAKSDGSALAWDGKMNTDPKKWTGTYPLGITLTSFSPIVLRSPDQFRPAAPPDFKKDMEELKNFKQTTKTTYQALYWANTGDLWTELAGQKMFEYRIMEDAAAVAQIYTILSVGYHDAAIAIMDAKYAYWGIRPVQYDTTYKPLITTPPFPGYPSGHAAGAATSCAILSYFFPADTKQFQQLAKECADSRFYAGIHFRTDNEVGLKMGTELGKYIVSSWLKTNHTYR